MAAGVGPSVRLPNPRRTRLTRPRAALRRTPGDPGTWPACAQRALQRCSPSLNRFEPELGAHTDVVFDTGLFASRQVPVTHLHYLPADYICSPSRRDPASGQGRSGRGRGNPTTPPPPHPSAFSQPAPKLRTVKKRSGLRSTAEPSLWAPPQEEQPLGSVESGTGPRREPSQDRDPDVWGAAGEPDVSGGRRRL